MPPLQVVAAAIIDSEKVLLVSKQEAPDVFYLPGGKPEGRQAPRVEQGLSEQGLRIIKLYLAVNREEQVRRLESRRADPLKIWKLSPLDVEGPKRWDEYTRALNDMFLFTHTAQTPWTVVNSNDKRTARINAIRYVLAQLPYADKDPKVARPPDPSIVGSPLDVWPELEILT